MGGIFNAQGPIAGEQAHLIIIAVLIMLTVAVPMLIALFYIAWRYRTGSKAGKKKTRTTKFEPDHVGNAPKQLFWWIVPTVIIVIISCINWKSTHAIDPYKSIPAPAGSDAETLQVEVVALRWKWLFIYPKQGIATVNYLEFPVDTPVHFDITADGPMSSFWIPELGSQIYAMSAMQTQLNLLASTTGVFEGKDTEINGDGYAGMIFPAHSVPQDEFTSWVASVKQSPGSLTENGYDTLSEPSSYEPPVFYGSVDPSLYGDILMKYMTPASSTETADASSAAVTSSAVVSTSSMPAMPDMQM